MAAAFILYCSSLVRACSSYCFCASYFVIVASKEKTRAVSSRQCAQNYRKMVYLSGQFWGWSNTINRHC